VSAPRENRDRAVSIPYGQETYADCRMRDDNSASLMVHSGAPLHDGLAAFRACFVADPDRGCGTKPTLATKRRPRALRVTHEKVAREAAMLEPLDWVRPYGPALFVVPTEPPPARSVTENSARDATVSEYCRAYSSLVRCAERPDDHREKSRHPARLSAIAVARVSTAKT
jgi:hypothetical protein